VSLFRSAARSRPTRSYSTAPCPHVAHGSQHPAGNNSIHAGVEVGIQQPRKLQPGFVNYVAVHCCRPVRSGFSGDPRRESERKCCCMRRLGAVCLDISVGDMCGSRRRADQRDDDLAGLSEAIGSRLVIRAASTAVQGSQFRLQIPVPTSRRFAQFADSTGTRRRTVVFAGYAVAG
jgi:hypothetical protein